MSLSESNFSNGVEHQYKVRFDGRAREFFGIWIVNLCLTIVTLGIYSAWAKVRTNRYFYGNTFLNDSGFEYLAEPITILKSRLVAVALFGGYSLVNQFLPAYSFYAMFVLLILIPAIIVLSISFRLRNTGYCGLTFSFNRNFKSAYLVYGVPFLVIVFFFAGIVFLAPEMDPETGEFIGDATTYFQSIGFISMALGVSFFALWPLWEYFKARFMVANTTYGQSSFAFNTGKAAFYPIYVGALIILLIALVATLLLFSVTHGLFNSGTYPSVLLESLAGIYTLLIFPLYLYVFAYIQAHRLNHIFNSTALTGVRLHSSLSANYLFYIYLTNTIAIVVSLGLLIPWVMIRTARYRAESVAVSSSTSLDHFIAAHEKERSAIGEEVGEVFDLDIAL